MGFPTVAKDGMASSAPDIDFERNDGDGWVRTPPGIELETNVRGGGVSTPAGIELETNGGSGRVSPPHSSRTRGWRGFPACWHQVGGERLLGGRPPAPCTEFEI